MWSTKKFNTPRAMASERRSLLTDRQTPRTICPPDSASCRSKGWLGPSLHVKGEITGNDDLLIDGSVEGSIQLDERILTIGTAAKLKADISARDVVVSGHVKGNVRATGRIEIKKDGSVIGNLTTAEILIEDGADFRGSVEIDRSTTKKPDREVAPLPFPVAGELRTNSNPQDGWAN